MYLEERVEQLEALAVDQGKQAETIAKGVAKLTVDTQQGIDDLKQGQAELRQEVTRLADLSDGTNERLTQLDRKMDQRLDQVNGKFDQVDNSFLQVDTRFDEVNDKFGQVDTRFDEVNNRFDQANTRFDQVEANQNGMSQDMNGMRQDIADLKAGQELILQILQEKLS